MAAIPNTVIQGSVGLGGANKRADVLLVQRLVNAVPTAKGGPMPALAVDGAIGPKTVAAISRFQKVNLGFGDGRIDPGKRTEQALLALLAALGALANLLSSPPGTPGPKGQHPQPGVPTTPPNVPDPPGKGPKTPPDVPTPPPVGGPQTPIRQRFMAICQSLLPPPGTLTQGQPGVGAKGTGCGELPGRVFARVPVIPPGHKGAFRITIQGGHTCYLTSPMTAWEPFSKAVDKQYAPARTWVPFSAARPLPGDIYILGQYDDPNRFQHVGIIVNAQGEEWTTADGGQGNGWQSGFVKRRFHAGGQIDGEFGNKAMLRGWVNLDALYAVAISAFPDNL